MILRTLTVGAALAFVLFSLPALGQDAAGQDTPKLKARVTVHGPLVTLGDLIEGAGEAAGTPVFRAPSLGMQGKVSSDRIVAAAAAQGIVGIAVDGIEVVSVSRLGREIKSDEIVNAIAQHLVATDRAELAQDVDVALDRFEQPVVVEQSATAMLTVDSFDYDAGTGRFSAVLAVADSNSVAGGLRFSGRAIEIVEVPVLARKIERGEVISPRDIVIDRLPRSALRDDMITDADRLTGMSARRVLKEGAPLSKDLLMEPLLVHRGDLVTIIYRSPGLTLTTRGRALSAGARGEVIQVYNIQSKRTVEAEISGPGFVTVMPQRVPMAALSANGG